MVAILILLNRPNKITIFVQKYVFVSLTIFPSCKSLFYVFINIKER